MFDEMNSTRKRSSCQAQEAPVIARILIRLVGCPDWVEFAVGDQANTFDLSRGKGGEARRGIDVVQVRLMRSNI